MWNASTIDFGKTRVVVLTGLLSLMLCGFFASGLQAGDRMSDIDITRAVSNTVADVAERVQPATVSVVAVRKVSQTVNAPRFNFRGPGMDDEFFKRFFGEDFYERHIPQNREQRVPSQGSGFIIKSDGIVVTNNHVVEDAYRLKVVLADKTSYDAELVGTDPKTDVAVLRLKDVKEELPTISFGDSKRLRVGEMVIAIGSPFGLSLSVTSGIVSAKGRTVGLADYENFIQTDAAINFGNSGGPLFNLDGKVVGINTAIKSPSGSNAGIGFAIPINMARDIIDQLLEHGKVTRGWIGVTIQPITPDMVDKFPGYSGEGGVLIPMVLPGHPADKAGMKAGDILLALGGEEIHNVAHLRNLVAETPVGKTVKAEVLRDGKRLSLDITIALQADDTAAALKPGDSGASPAHEEFGFDVQELTPELAKKFGYEDLKGVIVTKVDPDSDAADKGVTPGTLIMEVDRQEVADLEGFNKIMQDSADQDTILLYIRVRNAQRFITVNRME